MKSTFSEPSFLFHTSLHPCTIVGLINRDYVMRVCETPAEPQRPDGFTSCYWFSECTEISGPRLELHNTVLYTCVCVCNVLLTGVLCVQKQPVSLPPCNRPTSFLNLSNLSSDWIPDGVFFTLSALFLTKRYSYYIPGELWLFSVLSYTSICGNNLLQIISNSVKRDLPSSEGCKNSRAINRLNS